MVAIFPNCASILRLIGSVLIEQQDERLSAERRYMSLDSTQKLNQEPLGKTAYLSA
jgi:hypothetical protein